MTEPLPTLPQVLEAREARFARQRELLARYGRPLLCFTMNIAGERKTSPLIRLAFRAGLEQAAERFPAPLCAETRFPAAGPEAFFVLDLPAEDVKAQCVLLEDTAPAGRLYDLDVLTAAGEKLSRGAPRPCLVCGGPAAVCARSRAHGLAEVEARTGALLTEFLAGYAADEAVRALRDEAELTPKPGLVDGNNSGAHRDMDLALLRRSAEGLRPFFAAAVRLGTASPDCMPELQAAGAAAERNMLAATGGVNTHRGALYGLGLLLAALGSCLAREDGLFPRAAALARAGTPAENTHGAAVAAKTGARGARGEAEAGFPGVRRALRSLDENGGDLCGTLLELLLTCEDTNLLYRGGEEGLLFARRWARRALAAPPAEREALLLRMDRAFIARNLSPGGCADILAQALFLRRVGRKLSDSGAELPAFFFGPGGGEK